MASREATGTGPRGGPGSQRLRRKREQTYRDLLQAARGVLAAKGYHGTKIADIAQAAGVGVGTFYLYYPTKEAIFVELVEDTVRRLKSELDAVRACTPEPAAQARAAMETFFRFARDHRDLFRILFGHEAAFHDVVRRCQELFVRDAVRNLETGMSEGVFRKGRPELIAQAFIGMSLQVVSWWIEQEDLPMETVTEELARFAFYGLLNRPEGTPPA